MIDSGTAVPIALVRRLQIITGAMISSVVFFALIAVAQRLTRTTPAPPPPTNAAIIFAVSLTVLFVGVTLSTILPGVIESMRVRQLATRIRGGEKLDPPQIVEALCMIKVASQPIAIALLEAPAFMGIVTYMIGGDPIALAVPAVCIVLMLARFPTTARIRAWMTKRAALLAELLK